ncbi:MAG: T9SS type A sorting domain-containing protein, partial [Bacteroidota bacterium]
NLAFSTSLNGNDLTVIDQSSIPNNAQLDLTFGDGNSVGLQPGDTINYSYLSPGKYVICLEGVLALGETLICSDTICDTVDFVATAIESSSLGQSVNIYPNPSLGMLKVKFPQYPGSNSVLQLFDLQGKQVAVWPLADRLAHQFTVSSLPKGLYYLRIEHSEYFQGSQLIEIR